MQRGALTKTSCGGALISDDSTGPIDLGSQICTPLCESWGSNGKEDVQAAFTELFLLAVWNSVS
jgi:hypothetical protein